MDSNITISTRSLARLAIMVALIIGVGLLAMAVVQQRDSFLGIFGRSAESEIDRTTYQAVFLANNQVYFGKLESRGSDYLVLSDVYYLNTPTDGQEQVNQLVKRGQELHKPTDKMLIPIQQVLFIENLNPSSEMVDAIRRFKAGEVTVATPPATATAPRSPSASPGR